MKYIAAALVVFFAVPALATPVKEIKTPGGFTVWLIEEHSQPLIAAKIVFTGSGSSYDPNGKEGRAAAVSSLLLEGAGSMDSDAFSLALENSAVHLGFTISNDNFDAGLETLSENKDKAFSYLGLALTKPRFDKAATDRILRQTQAALKQQEEQPGYRLWRAWQKLVYADHPYGKPETGTPQSVASLKQADFTSYMNHYITRENIVIAVVGDITPEAISTLLDTSLAGLPKTYQPETKIAEVVLPKEGKQILVDQDIPQTIVHFSLPGVKREDPDYFSAYVMNYILGGGTLTSRLGTEIREKRGLAYAVDSALSPMMHAATLQGGFATRSEKINEALAVFKQTLSDYATNGPTEAEVTDAKNFLTGSFVLGLDSNSSIANFLINMQIYHLGIDYLDTRNDRMRKVTREEVTAIAKKLIDPAQLNIVMVGKPLPPEAAKP